MKNINLNGKLTRLSGANHIKAYNGGKLRLVAGICAGVIIVTAGIGTLVSHFKNKNKGVTTDLENTNPVIDTTDISLLGEEIEFPSEADQPRYGDVVSGNINKDELVVGVDPKTKEEVVYKNQEAKDKSKNIGKVQTDTKGGTLTVASNGKVYEKTESYEVKDSAGNVVASGEGSTPAGQVYDNNINAYVAPADANKYVIVDVDYYDPSTGEVVLSKGDTVEKDTLEKAKRVLTTSNTVVADNTVSTTDVVSAGPLYTDYGNIVEINTNLYNEAGELVFKQGDMVTKSSFESMASGLTTTKNVIYVDETPSANITRNEINWESFYTVNGMTFDSKADYEQWVINGYTGYSLLNGRMVSDYEVQKVLTR